MAPASSSTCGPDTSAGPWQRLQSGPRTTSAVRTATSSSGRVRSAYPYRSSCAVERLRHVPAERHRQLERLAGVAHVGFASAGSSPASASGTTYERT